MLSRTGLGGGEQQAALLTLALVETRKMRMKEECQQAEKEK